MRPVRTSFNSVKCRDKWDLDLLGQIEHSLTGVRAPNAVLMLKYDGVKVCHLLRHVFDGSSATWIEVADHLPACREEVIITPAQHPDDIKSFAAPAAEGHRLSK